MPQSTQCRKRNERGTVLVEFSLVFVIFAMICYGIAAFGMAVNLKQNLTHAATEGARSAVGAGACDLNDAAEFATCKAAKETAALARVADQLEGQSDRVEDAANANKAATVAHCSGSSGPYCITVTIDYPYGTEPVIPSAPGLGIFVPDTLDVKSVVQVSN